MGTTYARVTATGSYLPGAPVTNSDLVDILASKGVETSDEWIRSRTGITARHLASPGVSACDLAEQAARKALDTAGINATALDLIIVATSTPDYIFPSTACLLQARLGNKKAAAFDVQAVCSGFVYALSIAEKFICSGSHKKVLVVGAEVFSRILDWNDRSTCVLFGDGAGAIVLEASDTPGILTSAIHSDGEYSSLLNVPGQVSCGNVTGDPFLRMEGQSVFKFAVRVLSDVAQETCSLAYLDIAAVDWFVLHQANLRIITSVAKKLGISIDKFVVTLDQHANTSAASVPLALDQAVRDGRIQPGQKLLLEGVGGGFTWGAVALVY